MDPVNGLRDKRNTKKKPLNLLAFYADWDVTAHYPTLLRNTAGLARGINKCHEINSGKCLPHNPEGTTDPQGALAHLKTLQHADSVCRSEVSMEKKTKRNQKEKKRKEKRSSHSDYQN